MIVCKQLQFYTKQVQIMINLIVISAIGFLVQYVFGNESILSKLHQNTFKLKDVRIEVVRFNPEFHKQLDCIPFKYNRSTTVHNITMVLKVDVKDDVEGVVQVYKFLSNEYRHFPIRFQVNLKKALDSNAVGLKQALKCGNIRDFYFYKDITYSICNFFIDETQFPPLIPSGRYKVEIQFLYLNKETSTMALYGEVYTPIPYPKKPKFPKN